MEQTNQTPAVTKPADERKAWIKPELSKLDVETGGPFSGPEGGMYKS